MRRGIVLGAAMMLAPSEKNKGDFRRRQVAERMREYAANADRLHETRKHQRFWPKTMPGGWPLPPTVPPDDPAQWWHEDDGWPCPPPELRTAPESQPETLEPGA
jgi:hypothetical protein